ncbi:hypothetical protein WICPIJ_000176 [Wickerhamomyces pijperi]|uniref:Uncharacterized protein n=1 Tax=Wickerhamomyces pijperi TaxID=599730 RepID=A0A9P8QEG0_WICPI|nr:hypothetical protein WICPIJ_000176 [Wickerhamomyces pijperi]
MSENIQPLISQISPIDLFCRHRNSIVKEDPLINITNTHELETVSTQVSVNNITGPDLKEQIPPFKDNTIPNYQQPLQHSHLLQVLITTPQPTNLLSVVSTHHQIASPYPLSSYPPHPDHINLDIEDETPTQSVQNEFRSQELEKDASELFFTKRRPSIEKVSVEEPSPAAKEESIEDLTKFFTKRVKERVDHSPTDISRVAEQNNQQLPTISPDDYTTVNTEEVKMPDSFNDISDTDIVLNLQEVWSSVNIKDLSVKGSYLRLRFKHKTGLDFKPFIGPIQMGNHQTLYSTVITYNGLILGIGVGEYPFRSSDRAAYFISKFIQVPTTANSKRSANEVYPKLGIDTVTNREKMIKLYEEIIGNLQSMGRAEPQVQKTISRHSSKSKLKQKKQFFSSSKYFSAKQEPIRITKQKSKKPRDIYHQRDHLPKWKDHYSPSPPPPRDSHDYSLETADAQYEEYRRGDWSPRYDYEQDCERERELDDPQYQHHSIQRPTPNNGLYVPTQPRATNITQNPATDVSQRPRADTLFLMKKLTDSLGGTESQKKKKESTLNGDKDTEFTSLY